MRHWAQRHLAFGGEEGLPARREYKTAPRLSSYLSCLDRIGPLVGLTVEVKVRP